LREEDFARVIAEWRAWRPPASVERELKLPLSPTYIVAVAGPRQAGKTYRVFQLVLMEGARGGRDTAREHPLRQL